MSETQVGYDSIMERCTQEPLRQHLRAVHLSRKNSWCGSGTLILDKTDRHSMVITAGHVFSVNKKSEYIHYRVLQPWSKADLSIESARGGVMNSENPSVETDVAVCIPGELRRIRNFSHHTGGRWTEGKQFTPVKKEYPPAISLFTHEIVPVIGSVHGTDGNSYFVLQYHSYPGESGTGFLKAEDELYVLAAGIDMTPEISDVLGIPPEFPLVTLASSIKISW